jgi:hypothetical protein
VKIEDIFISGMWMKIKRQLKQIKWKIEKIARINRKEKIAKR